ncbi:MAG: DUF4352 domain-containing protein [Mycoplasmatales bacterium]
MKAQKVNNMKKLLSIFAVSVLVLSGCGATADTGSEVQEYKIGDEIQLKENKSLKITNIEKTQGTNEYLKPPEGKEFVVLSVEINNTGTDKNVSYNPFNYKMKNSQGVIEGVGFTTVDTETALGSGELAPGGTISGTLSIEQPVGDNGLVLIYDDYEDSLEIKLSN